MNRGILRLCLREAWPMTAAFAAGLLGLQIMLAAIVPSFQQEVTEILSHLKFVQQIFAALLGTDPDAAVGPAALSVLPWTHPIVLAMLWAHAIMQGTRVPAGDIDRGIIDWTLALPVRRTSLLVSHTAVTLAAGAALVAAGKLGNMIGTELSEPVAGPSATTRVIINVNLLMVYVCVAAVAIGCSSISDRRGRAVGVVFALLIASFFVNVLSTISSAVRRVDFLGILSYYRPMRIMNTNAWPTRDLLVLAAVALGFWLFGLWAFSRRDIRTV